jgi:hypothetical protein
MFGFDHDNEWLSTRGLLFCLVATWISLRPRRDAPEAG